MSASKKKILYSVIAVTLSVVLIVTTVYCANRFGWFKKGENPTPTPTATGTPTPTVAPTQSANNANANYYEVNFVTDDENIWVPADMLLEEGTPVYAITTPLKSAYIFTGWYTDADHTQLVGRDAVVDQNLTLYPDFAPQSGSEDAIFSIDYVASQNVAESFELYIEAYDITMEELLKLITVKNQSISNASVEYVLEAVNERRVWEDISEAELAEIEAAMPGMAEIIKGLEKTEATLRSELELEDDQDTKDALYEMGFNSRVVELFAKAFHFDEASKANSEYAYTYVIKPAVGKWNAGCLHQVEILDTTKARFIYDNQTMTDKVVYHNFTVYKADVDKLEVADDVIFIPASETTGIDIGQGFFSITTDANGNFSAERNNYSGSFQYNGSQSLHKGDLIAIYEGTLGADKRVDGRVSYFRIAEEPSGNSISYISAEFEDVIKMPEIFPVADDGSFDDHTVFIKTADLDYTKPVYSAFNFTADSAIEKGDFVAFYKGSVASLLEGNAVGYGCVVGVEEAQGGIKVLYNEVSLETIQNSVEYYGTQDNVDISLTDAEYEKLAQEIEEEAQQSEYYNALGEEIGKLVTDDSYDLSNSEYSDYYSKMNFTTSEGETLSLEEVRKLASGGRVKVSKPSIQALVTSKLSHFDGKGLRLEVGASFTVTIDMNKTETVQNQIVITVAAVLEQEVVLGMNVSFKFSWKFIIPVDVDVTVSLRAGTFTGFGIYATIQTASKSLFEDKSFAEVFNLTSEKNTGNAPNKLTQFADKLTTVKKSLSAISGYGVSKDKGGDKEVGNQTSLAAVSGGGFVEKYSAMLQNDAEYVRIIEKNLVTLECRPDPLQIIDITLGVNVFVAFKINAMVGFSISYGNAKQMSYSFCAKEKTGTQSNADLETPNFRTDFFAFGMIGVRAGFELDARVGLISTMFDSLGVLVEFGIQAEVYGFFYVAYYWESGKGSNTEMFGSVFFKFGPYIKVDFYAQLGNGKLGTKKTLYEYSHNLFTLGTEKFPLDFTIAKDSDKLSLTTNNANAIKVPDELFSIKAMKVDTGKEVTISMGSEDYDVTSDNAAFTYDNETHYVYINRSALPSDTMSAKANLTFTYTKKTFGINSVPITRTVTVEWNGKMCDSKFYDEKMDLIYTGHYIGPSPSSDIRNELAEKNIASLNEVKKGYHVAGMVYGSRSRKYTIYLGQSGASLNSQRYWSDYFSTGKWPLFSDLCYVIFERNKYTVNWEVDGKIVRTDLLEYESYLSAPKLTNDGYYLSDWTVNGEKLVAGAKVEDGDLTISAKWIKEHDHVWTNENIKQAATCTEKGLAEYTCSVCQETKTEELPIDPDNHTGDILTENYLAGTCSKEGYSGDDRCNKCNQIVALGQAIPKNPDNHDYTGEKVVKAATCTEKGIGAYVCGDCGYAKEYELALDPDNHTSKAVLENVKTADCSNAGYTGDEVCPDCHAVVKKGTATNKDASKHLHETTKVTKAATCSSKGEMTTSCSDCGSVIKTEEIALDATNHNSKTVLENVVAASCSAAGYSGDEVCPDCHAVVKKGTATAKDSSKHLHETSKVTKEATCSTKGEMTISCADCGAKIRTEAIALDATNHNSKTVLENVVAATCSADGYSGDEVCPDCHAVIKKGSTISSANAEHKWTLSEEHEMEYELSGDSSGSTIQAPYKVYICSVCEDEKTEVEKIKPFMATIESISKDLLLNWDCSTVDKFEEMLIAFCQPAVYIDNERVDLTAFDQCAGDQIVWAEDYSALYVEDITEDITLKAKYLPGDTENFESFEFEVTLLYEEPIYEIEPGYELEPGGMN